MKNKKIYIALREFLLGIFHNFVTFSRQRFKIFEIHYLFTLLNTFIYTKIIIIHIKYLLYFILFVYIKLECLFGLLCNDDNGMTKSGS